MVPPLANQRAGNLFFMVQPIVNPAVMKKILYTSDSWSPLVIRTLLGVVIFAHGAQKLFGWFGGYGFSNTMAFFTGVMGIPWILAFLVILLESVGALALVAGLCTRFLAFASFVMQ